MRLCVGEGEGEGEGEVLLSSLSSENRSSPSTCWSSRSSLVLALAVPEDALPSSPPSMP